MAINKMIVIGNLGASPEIRALPSGQNVANFSVATKARFKDQQRRAAGTHRMASNRRFREARGQLSAPAFARDARSTSRDG